MTTTGNTATQIHEPGDMVMVGATAIILTLQKSFSGRRPARWGWFIDGTDTASGRAFDSAEAAIDDATAKLTGERCPCGEIATMTASLGPACTNCYDRRSA
jgi:hypothetical protein